MKLIDIPLGAIDWTDIASESVSGTTGTATGRARVCGDIQMRMVDYDAGYVADHWCAKGHILFVVSGELTIEHQDGTRFELSRGMTWHVADGDSQIPAGEGADGGGFLSPHRVVCERGARVFIVD